MSPMMFMICENYIMKTPRNNGTIGLDKHLFILTWQYGNFNDFRIVLNNLIEEHFWKDENEYDPIRDKET